MRSGILSLFRRSPFEGLLRHAEIIGEAAPAFVKAFHAYLDGDKDEFEKHHIEVTILESRGDGVKRNIRGHLPRSVLLPMDKYQLLMYLREQDKILDSTQDVLHWMAYRATDIPREFKDDLSFMAEKADEMLRFIHPFVRAAETYFRTYGEGDRKLLKREIRQIRELEFQSDQIEHKLIPDFLSYPFADAVSNFHLVRLVEYLGDIFNHSENAADMMRSMIAR